MPFVQTRGKRKITVDTRAVEEEDTIWGITKIGAKAKPATLGHIKGLCVPFSLDTDETTIVYGQEMFFFGTEEELRVNFSGIPRIMHELNEYNVGTTPRGRCELYWIHIDELLLEGKRKEWVKQLQENPGEMIGQGLEDLIQVKITPTTRHSTGHLFSRFPQGLYEEAKKKGVFYRGRESVDEEVEGERYFVRGTKKLRVYSTPFGCLPDWAKKRRHR